MKVTKLSEIGVAAVRAVPSDRVTFSSCILGEYQFGNICILTYTRYGVRNTPVLMSLETAVTAPWRELFKESRIGIVAVDEIHCISEWLVKLIVEFFITAARKNTFIAY